PGIAPVAPPAAAPAPAPAPAAAPEAVPASGAPPPPLIGATLPGAGLRMPTGALVCGRPAKPDPPRWKVAPRLKLAVPGTLVWGGCPMLPRFHPVRPFQP